MKRTFKKTVLAVAVTSVFGLSSCSDNEKQSAIDTPITKSTSGVITGFGSVFINGVEYETDDASFVIDGVEGGEELLKLGMVVSLSGSASDNGTGTAVSIEFDDDIEGVVISTSLTPDGTGLLNIMGVEVTIDEDTVFESKSDNVLTISDIVAGNIVEVSGHSSGDGKVWATRIEVKSDAKEEGKEMEVEGTISNIDETATTFVLGTLTVNYADAELKLNKDITSLANNLFVEVKSTEGIVDGILIASKIELENDGKKPLFHDDNDEAVELEGVITNVVSSTEIEVNGHTVILSESTDYVHGSAEIAAVGMKIKIKGDVNTDGQLLANKVIFKPSGDLRLAGKISATDIDANTVTIFGKAITLSNSTLVKDDRDDDDLAAGENNVKYKFGVDDLAVGDWIKVKAYTNKDGGLTATKMIRKSVEEGQLEKLEGKLSLDATTSTFFISGIVLDLSSLTEVTPVDGEKVELKGNFENGIFTASEGEAKEKDEHYIPGNDADEGDPENKDKEKENNEQGEDDGKENDDVEEDDDDTEDDDSEDDDGENDDSSVNESDDTSNNSAP